MRVLVAGGAGYVGSKLVPALLEKGYEVTVLDLYLFGEEIFKHLRSHKGFKEVKGDIRDLKKVDESLEGCDHVIHLACISNDPSFELNPTLGKSINFDAFAPFVDACKRKKIQRFLYASSSSVYGVKDSPNVTEEMSLEPLTDYSKYKAACEKVLLDSLQGDMIGTVLRPATVCGYAPRQRLDVVVNILTNQAFHLKRMKVMGGGQLRPNIHIDDMVDAYLALLEAPAEKIHREIFNVGYHNHPVIEIAQIVARVIGNVEIEILPTNDHRSYHVSSDKIGAVLGFQAKRTLEDAVRGLAVAFQNGFLPNALEDERYYNIKRMKNLNLI